MRVYVIVKLYHFKTISFNSSVKNIILELLTEHSSVHFKLIHEKIL